MGCPDAPGGGVSLALDRIDGDAAAGAHHRLLVRPLDIEFHDLSYEVPSGSNNGVLSAQCSARSSSGLPALLLLQYCTAVRVHVRVLVLRECRGEAHPARTERALPERQPHGHHGPQRRRQDHLHERHRRLPVRSPFYTFSPATSTRLKPRAHVVLAFAPPALSLSLSLSLELISFEHQLAVTPREVSVAAYSYGLFEYYTVVYSLYSTGIGTFVFVLNVFANAKAAVSGALLERRSTLVHQ